MENLERAASGDTGSEWMKEEIAGVMSGVKCPACQGQRLKPVVLAVTVGDINISQFCEMSIREELAFIRANEDKLTEKQRQIGGQILKEIRTPSGVFAERGAGLPDPGPLGGHPVGRREPAHPADHPDRQRPVGGAVCAG